MNVLIEETMVDDLYVRQHLPEEGATKAVLFLHGYPGGQKHYDVADHLALQGFACYVMHYRGAWQSKGNYSLVSIYKDVERVLSFIEVEGFGREKISLIGASWGGFVAIDVYAQNPQLSKIVLLAPFINMDHDESKFQQGVEFIYSITKPSIKNYEKADIERDLRIIQKEHNPADKVGSLDGSKVVILHGMKDDICPIKYSVSLKERFKTPAVLFKLIDQDHFFHSRELLYDLCTRALATTSS
jgi:pimeloyl-ACP methyl ester carboxylesterase